MMTRELTRLGLLKSFVIVQQEKRDQALIRLITREGMGEGDAALLAGEHLLMTPEEDETEPQDQLDPTTTSPTPTPSSGVGRKRSSSATDAQ